MAPSTAEFVRFREYFLSGSKHGHAAGNAAFLSTFYTDILTFRTEQSVIERARRVFRHETDRKTVTEPWSVARFSDVRSP